MMSRLRSLLKNEEGNIAVTAALFMIVLLGMVGLALDGGKIYAEKSSLQKALDAAVLGGVQVIASKGEAEAITMAKTLGVKNAHSLDGGTFSTTSKSIKVSQEVKVPLTFARFLGFNEATVSASAKAISAPLTKGMRITPIAVEKDSLPHNTELKCENTGKNHGNCGYLAFEGRGASNLKDNIINGVEVSVGELGTVETEPGQKWGPVQDAFEILIRRDAGKPHCQSAATADKQCARVIYIVVIDTWDGVKGRDTVNAVGLAAYWLEGMPEKKRVTGKFLKMVTQGDIDGSAPDYGLYGVKLVE
ncbi:Tad domain-containing protein [Rossellomorea vietnamensis]|uniref:pilus assembly protein TadG-related protein n=1 Tax=Rossellomorea vietnamensis TaxID=218284 RepID=UPI001CCCA43C|nr:pilus assembly protein TadG-related protein [Rossellomorea vietnamensis]MCA0150477.1 Tad domain-containing protein [Rossellomorea vietnamensis]